MPLFRPFFLLLSVCLLQSTHKASAQKMRVLKDIFDVAFAEKDSVDVRYIHNFKGMFSPRIFLERRNLNFGFHPIGKPFDSKHYYPNRGATVGLAAYYGSLGLSFGVQLGKNNTEKERNLGKTKFYDFTINSYHPRYGLDVFVNYYKGFFEAKNGLFNPSTQVLVPYLQRSDVKMVSAGINYIHVVDPYRYSIQAPFLMIKQQKKSAGSLLWILSSNYAYTGGKQALDTLVPNVKTDTIRINRGNFLHAAIVPGYAYTHVVQEWFMSGTFFLGPGLQLQNYQRSPGERSIALAPMFKSGFRASVGYSGEQLFVALIAQIDYEQSKVERSRFQRRTDLIKVTTGLHF